jgi:Tol biopolymer transport system component
MTRWLCFVLLPTLALTPRDRTRADEPAAGALPGRLMIAYGSYKDRGRYPTITFYEHDGVSQGKVTGTIPPANLRSDSHPVLSHDGRWCAFTSEVENQTSKILLWDMQAKSLVDLPSLNDSPHALVHASLSGDGKWIALAAWNHPKSSPRWDVLTFDLATKSLLTPGGWNTLAHDERMPAMSGDASMIAFTTNSSAGTGLADIQLWDRNAAREIPLPGLNSPQRDVEPALSADGRLIAFVSDRPGGAGGRDVYAYDRQSSTFVPLPGLNSIAHEQMPSVSPDGRFIAFVSERRSGFGERDVFLYDRATGGLLTTPDLNSKREEIDPCVIVLQTR